ncbi:histidine phosphatase family protein [Streptomyces sp. NPDC057474]|uniref:histidine phosphatase family protein n=1 Tax=Streptomyces sp. NPDC057474 TaxID=3346144 RepID=UPI0036C285C0
MTAQMDGTAAADDRATETAPVPVPVPAPAPAPDEGLALPYTLASLWAIRHGQSTANVAYAEAERTGSAVPLPGRGAEVPLSELGRGQAGALGDWLAGIARGGDGEAGDSARSGPDLVVCSPYVRARQTWELMAGHPRVVPPPLLVDERLRDREMGIFEMHPPGAQRARAPAETARRALVGDWFYRPPGGEALTDVVLRVRDFVTELDRAAPGRRVLLVAHDAIAVAVRLVCAGLGATSPGRLPPVPNASVSQWETDDEGRLRLARWGDTAHLDLG